MGYARQTDEALRTPANMRSNKQKQLVNIVECSSTYRKIYTCEECGDCNDNVIMCSFGDHPDRQTLVFLCIPCRWDKKPDQDKDVRIAELKLQIKELRAGVSK